MARLSDVDPGILRRCAAVGLGIDARVTIVGHRPGSAVIDQRVTGRDVDLAETAASALWAVPACSCPGRPSSPDFSPPYRARGAARRVSSRVIP